MPYVRFVVGVKVEPDRRTEMGGFMGVLFHGILRGYPVLKEHQVRWPGRVGNRVARVGLRRSVVAPWNSGIRIYRVPKVSGV